MNRLQTPRIIRDRGQLTIPEAIRRIVGWITPLSAVTITVEKSDKISITPGIQKETDWKNIWNSIQLVRSFKGKNETKNETKNAHELIIADRMR